MCPFYHQLERHRAVEKPLKRSGCDEISTKFSKSKPTLQVKQAGANSSVTMNSQSKNMQTMSMFWFAKCDSLKSICQYGIVSRIDAAVYPSFVNLLSWYSKICFT